ncbi:hypothetical protein RJ640_021657 [Escallonia rubra]|uniref:Myb-like domain-containing protein n=1 Tax=Escallonia rubra TaxID=112253 RepID=A0AA88QT92_9ASTE|nr:hypothetical protein RJ640_021657 [Escallonia rubra]
MMDEFPNVLCGGWSWEENKLFELALAVIGEEDPNRWGLVAAMVGGNKNAEDVQRHYVALLQDVDSIESGHLDHKLGDAAAAPPYYDSTLSTSYLTDEAQRTLCSMTPGGQEFLEQVTERVPEEMVSKRLSEKRQHNT